MSASPLPPGVNRASGVIDGASSVMPLGGKGASGVIEGASSGVEGASRVIEGASNVVIASATWCQWSLWCHTAWFISQNLFVKSFCKSQFPHKSISLSFMITHVRPSGRRKAF